MFSLALLIVLEKIGFSIPEGSWHTQMGHGIEVLVLQARSFASLKLDSG
jgi:hypothetical protein